MARMTNVLLRNNWTDGEAFTHTDQNDVASEVNDKVNKATLTAKGDLFVATNSGTITRLPVGSDSQVLVADSTQITGIKWGVGASRSITVVTGPVTLGATANTDYVAALGPGAAATLPTAAGNTARYTIKNTTNSPVPVSTTSSQTVDGGPLVLGARESVDLVSDGSNWMVV